MRIRRTPTPLATLQTVPRRWLVLSLLSGMLGLVPLAPGQDVPAIRRLLINPDRLPQEMERLKQGLLIQLPRAEFEERVKQAQRSADNLKNPPRLTETRLFAVLHDSALIGTGRWQVLHAGTGPGLLPLPSMNLTLRSQPRSEKGETLLGEFDGKTNALLLTEPGANTVDLEWSAGGDTRPDGLSFELEVPSAPLASLELMLPPGWLVSVPEGVLLSGPGPLAQEGEPSREAMEALIRAEPRLAKALPAGSRLWTIYFGRTSRLSLSLRPTDRPGPTRLLVQRQQTTQTLFPDALEARYEMDLETINKGVRELTCECDPGLRPYAVSLRNLESWDVHPGATAEAPSLLHLRLKEVIHEGTLRIACLAPLRSPTKNGEGPVAWTSPGVHVREAVPRGETLVLRVHPELRMEGWNAGGFRLTESATEPDAERSISWQRLSLVGGGVVPDGKQSARPGARLQAHAVEYRARQLAWWQPTSTHAKLTLQIQYEVSLGQLFQLPVQLPSGWNVQSVEMTPEGLFGSSRLRRDKDRTVLLVDLVRPLSSPQQSPISAEALRNLPGPALLPGNGHNGTLTITLGTKTGHASARRVLPFPDAIPLGARFREGVLAIGVDTSLQATEVKTQAVVEDSQEEGPWGRQSPVYSFLYRDKPPQGTLILQPRAPEIRARCRTDVFLAENRAGLEAELTVESEAGATEAVHLFFAGQKIPPWTWRSATAGTTVIRTERLLGLEAASVAGALTGMSGFFQEPWAPLTTLAVLPRGQHWRLVLSRPLRPAERIRLLGTAIGDAVPAGAEKAIFRVPLVQAPGARRLEGEVRLHFNGQQDLEITASGLREFSDGFRPDAEGSPSRQFRYGSKPIRLEIEEHRQSGRVALDHVPVRGQLWDARLTSWLRPDGALQSHYTFRLTGWDQSSVPMHLPPGSRLMAAAVNGHWIDSLLPDHSAETVDLPVPRTMMSVPLTGYSEGPAQLRFEILYVRDLPGWWLWARIEADPPVLPLEPINLQRFWRLPTGIRPVWGGESLLTEVVQQAWTLSGKRPPGLQLQSWRPGEEMKRESPKGSENARVPLAEMLQLLIDQAWKEHRPLVVDGVALSQAGLDLSSPPSEAVPPGGGVSLKTWGLVAVALPSAIVVTSPHQLNLWQDPASRTTEDALDRLMKGTLRHGHEGEGRFRLAQDYLADPDALRPPPRLLLAPPRFLSQWNEFETGADLIVVQARTVYGLAALVSALLVALLLGGRWRKPARRSLFLWSWLMGAGLLWFWLPPALEALALGPLVAGLGCAMGWYLLFLFRHPGTGGIHRHAPATQLRPPDRIGSEIVPALLLLGLATWSWADNPPALAPAATPFPVYVVPEKGDVQGDGSVLVPPELLDQLQSVQRAGQPGAPGQAVPLTAVYEARLIDGVVEIDAVFTIVSLTDDTTLALPLQGASLDRVRPVWLDNEKATPLPLPLPDRPGERGTGGWAIRVPTKGRHKLEVRLQVGARTGATGDHTIQVTLPRIPASRFRFQAPAGAMRLQAFNTHGWQRLTPGEGDKGGPVLEADIGRGNGPIQLTWQHNAGSTPVKPGRVQFQEAYLWNLRGDASGLSGLIHYHISDGSMPRLSLDLPAELEVRGAEAFRVLPHPARSPMDPRNARPLPLEPIKEVSGRLSGWRVEGNGPASVLHLDFQNSVTGDLVVALDLVPRKALTATVQLPLPTPHGQPLPGKGYLAYQTQGIEAVRQRTLNVTGSQSADFAPFWPTGSRPAEKSLQYCCTFRREPGAPPLLQLHLTWPSPVVQVTQEVQLRVGLTQAELWAGIDVAMPNKDLGLIQWEIQAPTAWTVAAVSGPDVRRWSQSGRRLLIWLERTSALTHVELAGWLNLAGDGHARRLELPRLLVDSAEMQKTTIRLLPEPGVVLTSLSLRGLQAGTAPPQIETAGTGERIYQTQDASYGGTLAVQSSGATLPRGTGRMLMLAEIVDRHLLFSATLVYRLRAGDARTIQVRLRDWDGGKMDLSGSGLTGESIRRLEPALAGQPSVTNAGDHNWTVDLPAGTDKPRSLTLRGQKPLSEVRQGMWMPEVRIGGLTIQETWLGVAGKDLGALGQARLVPQRDLAAVLAGWRKTGMVEFWPREADRLRRSGGVLWRSASGGPANLRLVPNPARLAEALPLRLLLGEQSAAVVDSRHWVHEATWWLQQQGRTDLTLGFPSPVQVLTVNVDGAEITPIQPEPERLRLPLSGPGGVHQVRLRWRYSEGIESLERPKLDPPQLEKAQIGPLVWTVHVPPGYIPKNRSRSAPLKPGRAAAAQLALYRASVFDQVLANLSENSGDKESELIRDEAARNLVRYCQVAERDLALADLGGNEKGPAGQTLGDWLVQLKDRIRQSADANARDLEPTKVGPSLPIMGTPYYGVSRSVNDIPDVLLISAQRQRSQQALLASGEWAGLLACLWIMSLFPYVPTLARLLWPEQLAAIALAGWLLGLTTLVAVTILALALGARVLLLGFWLRRTM